MPNGKCRFNAQKLGVLCLTKPAYKIWLAKGKDEFHAKCKVCDTQISIASGISSGLKSHASYVSHNRKVAEKEDSIKSMQPLHFLSSMNAASSSGNSTSTPTSSDNPRAASNSSSDTTSESFDASLKHQVEVSKAEILWALKCTESHISFRSSLGINDLFANMFTDSQVAAGFQMSKTKVRYLLCYGIAPYYRENLLRDIQRSPTYSVSFDESLNEVLQKQQMDIVIRYWDHATNTAISRYWDSSFQYFGKCKNLTVELMAYIKNIGATNMHHLSMDGPNVNWAIERTMSEERNAQKLPPMEKIGSCGLHVVSGAFQTGCGQTGWNVDKILHASWKLLDKSPARRGEYAALFGDENTVLFPKKFCKTRWVENAEVAGRAIQVWPKIVALIEKFEKRVPSERPKNKSYGHLKEAYTDKNVVIYLTIFRDVASQLEVFLKTFQTDAPMVPFLSDTLEKITRRLMRYILKKDVVNAAVTPHKLMKLDVLAEKNLKPVNEVKMPTGPLLLVQALKTSSKRNAILASFSSMIKGLLTKLQERSPMSYRFVRCCSVLSPINMVNDSNEELELKFDTFSNTLHAHNRISSVETDAAKEEFESFLVEVNQNYATEFKAYNQASDRLDTFLHKFIAGKNYNNFWKVCQLVFTMSHGQSAVERGFNINADTLATNLQELSLRSLRLVYDQIKINGNISQYEIPKVLHFSYSNSHPLTNKKTIFKSHFSQNPISRKHLKDKSRYTTGTQS